MAAAKKMANHMIQAKRFAPYLLVIACVIANGLQLRATIYAYGPSNDLVQEWENRMLPIRDAFPRNAYAAGYLQNSDIAGAPPADDASGFLMSQYIMAPVVLTPALGPDWTIGNFRGVPIRYIRAALLARPGKFTIEYVGSGFYLIHKIGD
jgi:hypothetical protein